jgi:UTP:GlnB (protein PII) uridylyltransferase
MTCFTAIMRAAPAVWRFIVFAIGRPGGEALASGIAMTINLIEDVRQAVVTVAEQPDNGIAGVLLIGSYARGEQCANSDIDLIVTVTSALTNAIAC